MAITLNPSLRTEYQDLFDTCVINPAKAAEVEPLVTKIEKNKPRYAAVGGTKIPWYFIGVIHNMECSQNFTQHLHNGDPLTKRTTHVPAGRPVSGSPPFSWEQSAIDALGMKKLFDWTDWTIPGMLFKLEQYNGFSYRMKFPHVKSPYLWSFSNQYTKGKFVADHVFSETAVSKQCGAAVLLRRLAEKQAIKFDKAGDPTLGNTPATTGPNITTMAPLVRYAPKTFS